MNKITRISDKEIEVTNTIQVDDLRVELADKQKDVTSLQGLQTSAQLYADEKKKELQNQIDPLQARIDQINVILSTP